MDAGVSGMDSRSVTVFAVTIAFFVTATIFVFFRMLSRAWIVKRISIDDYVMMLAWLLAFGLAFTICYAATVGLGRHEVDVPESWQNPLRTSQYAFSLLYQPALMAEKTSILVFYLTLSNANKTFRWATIATLVVVNAVGFGLTMFTAFQCSPPSAAYRYPTPDSATCTDIVTIYLSSSPVNIITDLAILILPMPILTGMRLPKKQKWILVVTFSFGIFVAVVDVIRVAYLQNASTYRISQITDTNKDDGSTQEADFSWYASLSFMWTAIEVNVGIMCACVPGLKPLVSRFAPKFIHDYSQTREERSVDNTAQMIEDHQVPTFVGEEVTHHDFAPPSPTLPRQAARPQPLPQNADLDMMEFLTMPGDQAPTSPNIASGARLGRTDTVMTNTSRDTHAATPTFFDFVNMQGKKSMVHMTNRESIFPVSMVTLLFFLWGFEYGLLDVLNKQFQLVAMMSPGQNVALHSAYFVGYLIGPLTLGRLVLKNWGFKSCYNVGLAIYACGTLIFWVAAVLTSFPAYIIVNVIVGIGLSVLETGANPFIALCGPPQYSEIRLNLSQGFQAIGTIVAPLIASKAFSKYTNDAPSLVNTQWAYLGIALFTIAIAFAYYYVPLPEATDAELEDASERLDHAHHARISLTSSSNASSPASPSSNSSSSAIRVTTIILALGVLSQFSYVGAQEIYATTFAPYLSLVRPQTNSTDFMAIAHTAFAVSRFVAAGLNVFVKPRYLLLSFFALAIIFSALVVGLADGDAGLAMLVMVFFAEGPIFGFIYAQCLRGQGRRTKDAAVLLTAAIGGGAVWPAISYGVQTVKGAKVALVIGIAAFVVGAMLPLALCGAKRLGRVVEPIHPDHGSDGSGADREDRIRDHVGIGGLRLPKRRRSRAEKRKSRTSTAGRGSDTSAEHKEVDEGSGPIRDGSPLPTMVN